ncbi:MAG TPA: hypothetical protein VLJ61_11480 [Pyrinomonadaceae bacterium]|nr:hypothetical protein [Pyrinomonadaceae bacterium]
MAETDLKMMAEAEVWQVLTPEGVFDADLQTLKQWIVEGAVQPSDKVRKGSLKWIDAARAPMLRRAFAGEETPAPPAPASAQHGAVATTQTVAASDAHTHAVAPALQPQTFAVAQIQTAVPVASVAPLHDEPEFGGAQPLGSSCHFHAFEAATLVCRSCQTTMCRACPKKVGASSVFLCPLCGGFCDPLKPIIERQALYDFQGSGFGFADFAQALRYPFKHFASLLGGALLYAILLMAGLSGQIIALGLIYGCITVVIHRVAYGRLERDFMPDFGDFSIWDDVVHPAFLGLGVTLVTLGPVLLLAAALVFGWLGGARRPATPVFPLPQTQPAEQSYGISPANVATAEGETARKQDQERAVEQLQKQFDEVRAQTQKDEDSSKAIVITRQLIAHPGLILVLALLALAWAVFYHPMALLVAGWTESFKSTINPLVGLDTIRHMGSNYFKAFLMYAVVQLIGLGIQIVVALVTAPFDLPLVGNLPGKFVGGIFTFYTSLVIACVLGLSLFKSADRFGIEID